MNQEKQLLSVSYINDIHIDHWVNFNHNEEKYRSRVQWFIADLVLKSRLVRHDLLIVAGDISHYNRVTKWVLEEFTQWFKQVIFVGGNHDYYLVSGTQRRKYKNSLARKEELYEMTIDIPNLVILGTYRDVTQYKGFNIGGLTMTSLPSLPSEKLFHEKFMNDSRYINVPVEQLNNIDTQRYTKLEKANLDIFISHYPLIKTGSHKKYGRSSLGSYLCRVDQFVAKHNFFGHVHENREQYEVLGTKHYTNAIGYPQERLNSIIREVRIGKEGLYE